MFPSIEALPPELLWTVAAVAAIGLGAVLWIAIDWRRSLYTLPQYLLLTWNWAMTRLLWRARVSGPLPVPSDQGAVIICNHRSPTDPGYIALASDRAVHWMVAKEYCNHWALAWFFRAFGTIPVSRGGIDTAATKMAIRYAQAGGLVGLFPEGRINTTDDVLLPGRPGAALIALKARVPVVPCYVSGSPYNGSIFGVFFTRAQVTLRVGRPIDLSEFHGRENQREVLREVTCLFLTEIARLAGVENFEPKLAGRFYKPADEAANMADIPHESPPGLQPNNLNSPENPNNPVNHHEPRRPGGLAEGERG
jgi:1-acyl-sn-glycerol-3-phosphate acyltransferase